MLESKFRDRRKHGSIQSGWRRVDGVLRQRAMTPAATAPPTTKHDAERVVRDVLARGANRTAALWLLSGLFVLVIGGLCLARVVERLMWPGYLGDSGEQCLLAGVPLFLVGAYLTIVRGIRSLGVRGTRAARIVLDFPERASIQPVVREIRVNGVPVRTAHFVSITVDGGDALEVELSPHEMGRALDAFATWCGRAAVDDRILDLRGA